jgi:hypothetical protein
MELDCGHWKCLSGVCVDEGMFGFIYEIANTVTGKKYIGKKQCFQQIKRNPLKGKKRRRIEKKTSDWKTYTGSCNELNSDIEVYGKNKFSFTIIKVCNSKWGLAYYEIKEQIERGVLLSDDFYNGIINVRIGKIPNSEKIA